MTSRLRKATAVSSGGTVPGVGTPRPRTFATRVHDLLHRNATLGPLFVLQALSEVGVEAAAHVPRQKDESPP